MSAIQVITLVGWMVAAALVVTMALIARFYQRTAGQASAYGLLLVAAVLIALVGLRRALTGDAVPSDLVADTVAFLAGAVLIGQCHWLYARMTRRRE